LWVLFTKIQSLSVLIDIADHAGPLVQYLVGFVHKNPTS
jgi:hypothetical protein